MGERTVQTDTDYDSKATETTRRRYQRNASFYDWMEGGMEKQHAAWREQLWPLVNGPKVLEVGVGTGKNIPITPLVWKSPASI